MTSGPVVVTVGGVASNGVTFTVIYAPRLNAGGNSFTDGSGNFWAADQSYSTGNLWGNTGGSTFSTTDPIANTTNDVLYQSERFGNFGYKFDLPNGRYNVTLYFAEIYTGTSGPNQRIFNVSIEGAQVLTNYDIAADVGFETAVAKSFPGILVQDGQLNIDLLTIVGNAKISAIQILPDQPARLGFGAINSGNPPVAGTPFSVVVQSQDTFGNPINVSSATGVSLTRQSGTGDLTGTLAGTIPAGSSQVIISNVSYSKAENGVILRATRTSGDPLTTGDSAPFAVIAGTGTKLGFVTQPGNTAAGNALPGPPVVAVQDSLGNTVAAAAAQITVAIGTNPGSGTLNGTTQRNAVSGMAIFADLRINQPGNGYTLTASSPGLTGATSSAFNLVAGGTISGTVTRTGTGAPIGGASIEVLQASVVKRTATTAANGSYSMSGLPVGTYDVRVNASGYLSQTQGGLGVIGGNTTTANFSLTAAVPTAGIIYIYDELSRLKSVIDPVGESASYAYDAVGNLLAITRNNASQTSIVDFNPNGGPVGSGVTIYGTGYSATPSQNSVTFNGVAATVISSTLTRIVTTVPAGATTGPIAVTTPAGGAISSTNFNVTGAPVSAPTLASFTPAIGVPGTAVTITGTNFDTTQNNDEVRFSPALATVSTATTTSISTIVPVGARSGKLSVSTPNGTAISTQDFFVPPSGLTANDVDFTSRITIGGPALVMTVNTANKVAVALFEGIAGQRFSIKVSDSTFPDTGPFTSTAFLQILKPDGFQFGSPYGWHSPNGSLYQAGTTSPNFVDVQTLPMTGTYTLILDPNGTNTGQATITFYNIPPDLQGPIVPGGAPVNVVTTIPGQNGSFTFAGTQGQIVSVKVTDSTYPDLGAFTSSAILNLLKPDGSVLTSISWHSPNGSLYQASTTSDNFLNAVTLPTTGTYTLQVDPNWTHVGQVTLALYDVPAENQGTIAVGGAPVTVSTTVPGQNARLTFTANANQVVTVRVDNSTYPNLGMFTSSAILNLIKPNGAVQGWTSWNETTGNYLVAQTLATPGTYTLQVDPNWTHTGQVRVTLYDVVDIAGTIVPGGSPVTVTTTIPGQNAKLTFNGTAGQRVSLQMTGVTMPWAIVSLNNPVLGALVANQKYDIKMEYFDGSGAAQAQLRWSSPSTAEQIIPSSSLYLPGGITVGGLQGDYFNNTLSGAPALTRTDSTVNFTWSGSAGAGVTSDNFEARWTGQVQAQFSETYQFCTITDDGVRVWINDVPVIDQWVNQGAITSCTGAPISMANTGVGPGGAFIDSIILPVTGTYSINIDPADSSTGQITLTLYDVPADPTASITIGGSPVTVTTTTPGQNAKLTFSGTAGQRVNLQMTGVTIPWALVTMANPTLGALVANQKYDVKMEYFDNGGDAQAHLLWNSPSTSEQAIPSSKLYLPGGVTVGGLQGDYFNNTALSGAPALSRTDSAVDFSWSGSPGQGVASDSFAVRWTGQVQAQLSESYQLCTVTDDGVRLWINDLPVIDKWPAQGPVKWCTGVPVNLANTAGIGTGGGSIINVLLPVTGTYSIVVNPDAASGGSMTLTLVTAP